MEMEWPGWARPGHAMGLAPPSVWLPRAQPQPIAMPRLLQRLPDAATAHPRPVAHSAATQRAILPLPLGSSSSSGGGSGGDDACASSSSCADDDARAGLARARITCMQNVEDRAAGGGVSARAGELSTRDAFWNDVMAHVRSKPGGQPGYFYVAALPQSLAELLPLAPDVDPEVCLALYNKLLRADRLQDCLVLLDHMDRAGILDMNKVLHMRFYEECKTRKAVAEAFRFTLLIKEATLRKYTMLLSVCAAAADADGALKAFSLLEREGLKADCIIYTAAISTCAKAGCVDLGFKLFFEMDSVGVKPNQHTFGAMIDGCARAGLLAKAFGVYGIMLSKKVKPDIVIFNSLINACGRAGAVDRAFDVLSDMKNEDTRVEPDHVTYGALICACIRAGQVDRGLEVYKNMHDSGFVGSPEVYTAAVHAHSLTKNVEGAFEVLNDLRTKGVKPDDVFFSALIDVAGQARKIDVAYSILEEMRKSSMTPGPPAYSAMMGVCSIMKDWEKALVVYEEMKKTAVIPTVSTLNALMNALCSGKLLLKAIDLLKEIRDAGVSPDQITYTILLNACRRSNEAEHAFDLHMSMMSEGLSPSLTICDCITGICLRRVQASAPAPDFSCHLGPLQADLCKGAAHEQWASWALAIYRQTISAGIVPTIYALAQLFGCLRTPESEFRTSVGGGNGGLFSQVKEDTFASNTMLDGSRIYDPRALSLYEEAASLGVVPHFSYTAGPLVVQTEDMPPYVAEVCILTVLKSLKHRLAAGAKIQPIIICLPTERKETFIVKNDNKKIFVFGRTGQAVMALLRRLRLRCERRRTWGKIRLSSAAIQNFLQPASTSNPAISFRLQDAAFSYTKLAKGLRDQQREIRMKSSYPSESDGTQKPDAFRTFRKPQSDWLGE